MDYAVADLGPEKLVARLCRASGADGVRRRRPAGLAAEPWASGSPLRDFLLLTSWPGPQSPTPERPRRLAGSGGLGARPGRPAPCRGMAAPRSLSTSRRATPASCCAQPCGRRMSSPTRPHRPAHRDGVLSAPRTRTRPASFGVSYVVGAFTRTGSSRSAARGPRHGTTKPLRAGVARHLAEEGRAKRFRGQSTSRFFASASQFSVRRCPESPSCGRIAHSDTSEAVPEPSPTFARPARPGRSRDRRRQGCRRCSRTAELSGYSA